jgi:hypothetical protein
MCTLLITRTKILVVFAALVVTLAACAASEPTATPATRDSQEPLTAVQITAETAAKTKRAQEAAATAQPTETPAPTDTFEPKEAPTVIASATPTPESTSSAEQEAEGAANADVLFVRAVRAADGTWAFHVTVEHPDSGWEDYADGWDVVTPDDEVLKPNADDPFTRLLLHPHENEQPFTRSQSRIVIPDAVTQVRVRAHDLVDGYGGREVVVDLTAESGLDFEVER